MVRVEEEEKEPAKGWGGVGCASCGKKKRGAVAGQGAAVFVPVASWICTNGLSVRLLRPIPLIPPSVCGRPAYVYVCTGVCVCVGRLASQLVGFTRERQIVTLLLDYAIRRGARSSVLVTRTGRVNVGIFRERDLSADVAS